MDIKSIDREKLQHGKTIVHSLVIIDAQCNAHGTLFRWLMNAVIIKFINTESFVQNLVQLEIDFLLKWK